MNDFITPAIQMLIRKARIYRYFRTVLIMLCPPSFVKIILKCHLYAISSQTFVWFCLMKLINEPESLPP